MNLMCVYATNNSVSLAFAKSLLENEGIPCTTQGGILADFFSRSTLGRHAQLLVAPEHFETARALLADLSDGELMDYEAGDSEDDPAAEED